MIHPVAAVTHPLPSDWLRDLDAINCSPAFEEFGMYLVVVNGAFDDVPVRLFGGLKEAKAYAKQRWDAKENEATEELYRDTWGVSQSANLPAINEIAGIQVLRFRDGVVVGCVCHISGRVKSGNVD